MKKFICALICLCLIATTSSAAGLTARGKIIVAVAFVSACVFAEVGMRAWANRAQTARLDAAAERLVDMFIILREIDRNETAHDANARIDWVARLRAILLHSVRTPAPARIDWVARLQGERE
jgi:hypothetical protein